MPSSKAVEDLLARIKGSSAAERTGAWFGSGALGAGAVVPLAGVMRDHPKKLEVARAAKNALWQIVRHAGRPAAKEEAKAVVVELVSLLGDDFPTAVRREVLWMLSEIGGDECVAAVSTLLFHKDLREDARCVLQRLPGPGAPAALQAALARAPEDFKGNLAQSLRARGVAVAAPPCRKLLPTRKTSVKPVK